LPHFEEPPGAVVEDGWKTVNAVGFPSTPFRLLEGGALVMLGVPFVYPDEELYAQSVSWFPRNGTNGATEGAPWLPKRRRKLPRRIWVFPDVLVPDVSTAAEVERATKGSGRWVSAGKRRSPFEELGFTASEHREWLKEAMSGDPARVEAARERLEQRLAGRSEEEIDAMVRNFLRRS
jgi:hypothetical protein